MKDLEIKQPSFYVFPIDILARVRRDKGWNKVSIKKVDDLKLYKDNGLQLKNSCKTTKLCLTTKPSPVGAKLHFVSNIACK